MDKIVSSRDDLLKSVQECEKKMNTAKLSFDKIQSQADMADTAFKEAKRNMDHAQDQLDTFDNKVILNAFYDLKINYLTNVRQCDRIENHAKTTT